MKRVLIFEDYHNLGIIFSNGLEKHFEVMVFSSSTNLEKVKKFNPDIIIFDHSNNINGIKLLKQIQALKIEFQPVFRTLYADDKNIINDIAARCDIPMEWIKNKSIPETEFCEFLTGLVS